MVKTFKIQRTNEADLTVTGKVVAEAAGWRYYMRVVETLAGAFVLVIGDQVDEWQTTHYVLSRTGLLHTLHSFDTEPPVPGVRSLVNGWPDDVRVWQDLLEVVDAVLREIGGYADRAA
ncbi:MAG: hypothetical protein ABFC88_13025 [Thermoguttaceae bacterium]